VAGVVRGTDPALADEYLVFTAHHDHLGLDPNPEGDDNIFNGALDNALGVAGMLAAAEAAVVAPPRRSMIFVAVTAEEGGLLGSSAFVTDPPVPLDQIVANFNIDSPQSFGLTHDVGAIGLEMSSLGAAFAEIAAEQGFRAVGDPNPNAGSFYRSDQVNFAKAGIPALYLQRGKDFVTPPGFDAEELRLSNYHQVTDEILPEWDLAGVERDVRILFETGVRAANADDQPRWVAGHEFEEEWQKLYGR
jgi:Zn-dependent M28 family amino/carboxypeptidase